MLVSGESNVKVDGLVESSTSSQWKDLIILFQTVAAVVSRAALILRLIRP